MPTPRAPVSPDAILNAALRKEESARDFYARLADGCTVDFVRDLLETLQNEESRHVRMIQDIQARLRAGRKLT